MTAVSHNSGATTLAFDLANDVNQMEGRAIVIELNTVNPDARYNNDTQTAGVVDFIHATDMQIEQLIRPATADYPERIAIGVTDGSLLVGYARLHAALRKLAETYSVVILDAAPILLSADVEYFSSISDITLLLIAAQESKPGEIKRAVQHLERLDPTAIAFIVTRLQIFKGGGYYAKIYQRITHHKQDAENPIT
jgi:Mrp family chromosome partitioning ATPase